LLSEQLDSQLPFLFKVLSVNQSLSIQAHPDKALAKELHTRDPKNYPDDNHKPEVAIALTKFEALCSFRLQSEIQASFSYYPELCFLSPVTNIRVMFENVMRASRGKVQMVAEKLISKYSGPEIDLFVGLWRLYPNDVGCFCVFLLNYVVLQPGEAIFLSANEPHTYLAGDCVECMAASDNVVRAGLTPKFRDLETLLRMLTYRQVKPADLIVRPQPEHSGMELYSVPVKEFAVACGKTDKKLNVPVKSGAIVIFISGTGKVGDEEYSPGAVFYSKNSLEITPSANTAFYMAYQP
jgi:mannose-6-phosphate isomerase